MPFQKNNTLWKEGLKQKRKNKERIDTFFEIVADGGIAQYGAKLEALANKEELTKEELEFMDRFEKLFEYVRPKLARQEHTGKNGKELSINLIRFDADDTAQLPTKGVSATSFKSD